MERRPAGAGSPRQRGLGPSGAPAATGSPACGNNWSGAGQEWGTCDSNAQARAARLQELEALAVVAVEVVRRQRQPRLGRLLGQRRVGRGRQRALRARRRARVRAIVAACRARAHVHLHFCARCAACAIHAAMWTRLSSRYAARPSLVLRRLVRMRNAAEAKPRVPAGLAAYQAWRPELPTPSCFASGVQALGRSTGRAQ